MSDVHPLKLAYAREYPAELALYLARQGGDAVAQGLAGLPAGAAAAVVARLPYGHAARLLNGQSDEELLSWLNAASLDHALAILLHLERERRKRVLARLSNRGARRQLERLVVYPRKTLGALVDPTALRLSEEASLEEAVALLRSDQPEPEEDSWVVDAQGAYRGLLDINGVLLARSQTAKLSDFLINVNPLRAETALETARDYPEWQLHPELPVVDHRNYFLGTVTLRHLQAALAGQAEGGGGVADGLSDLTRQYFRFLQASLLELFSPGRRRR